jgi:hypothetical protein
MGTIRRLIVCGALILWSFASLAYASEEVPATIPIGTKITMGNWQQYRQFMPDGMSGLFEGKYFWKMPADVEMDIGPTRAFAPPAGFVFATEKYGGQAQAVVLPDGRHDLKNYVGGMPFPNPSEPNKGWKILADDWLPPAAWIYAGTPDTGLLTGCGQDKLHNLSCSKLAFVYRQLGFLTYPGQPQSEGAGDVYLTEWAMIEEPEQFKYITELTIFYQDVKREEDNYVFLPALRRSLRTATTARCAPAGGGDFTKDDVRAGFNGGISIFDAQFLRDQRILTLTDLTTEDSVFPANWDMPLGWPKPSWGPWSLRDVWVIDVRRIPLLKLGYCYGSRIMHIDKKFQHELWSDLYDVNMKLWKVSLLEASSKLINGVATSIVTTFAEQMWDVQNNHSTIVFSAAGPGRDIMVNDEVPKQYLDIPRYSTPSGLMEIMQ